MYFRWNLPLKSKFYVYIYGYHLGDNGMHSKAVIAYNLLKCKNTIIVFFLEQLFQEENLVVTAWVLNTALQSQ